MSSVTGSRFLIGSEVFREDERSGRLQELVLDPAARRITHVVVGADRARGRLVPLDLVEVAGHRVRVVCSAERFLTLRTVQKRRVVPVSEADFAVGTVPHENIPRGETVIHDGETVRAARGAAGRVRGLICEADDAGAVTFLLVETGHLWWRKVVAVPVRWIGGFRAGIELTVSRWAVRGLPAVGNR